MPRSRCEHSKLFKRPFVTHQAHASLDPKSSYPFFYRLYILFQANCLILIAILLFDRQLTCGRNGFPFGLVHGWWFIVQINKIHAHLITIKFVLVQLWFSYSFIYLWTSVPFLFLINSFFIALRGRWLTYENTTLIDFFSSVSLHPQIHEVLVPLRVREEEP